MSTQTTSRGRRWARYREIAKILYEERVMNLLALFRDSGIGVEAGEAEAHDGEPARHEAAGRRAAAAEPPDEKHAPKEVRLRHALERLGPAFVKVGQLLSTRRDLVPPALADELAKLQDNVPTLPFDTIRKRIEDELGATLPELFASFDEQPIASASIGQVYLATLPGGEEVVVKVQRPGISEVMEVDLDILLTQARKAAEHTRWGRDLNVVGIADQVVGALRSELDYLQEANNIEFFHHAFNGSKEVYFPNVNWDLTTSRVLTMERMKGEPATRVVQDGCGVDGGKIAENGASCYFKQIFDMGRYHADPHLGNLFLMPDGRVGFVDFGRVGYISERNRSVTFQVILAMVDGDEVGLTESVIEMTRADAAIDIGELQRDMATVCTAYAAAQTAGASLEPAVRALFDAVRKFRLAVPGEVTMLLTVLGILDGVASQLGGPDFHIAEVVRPYAARMLPEQFGPDHAKRYMMRWVQRYGRFLDELPISASRALRRVGEGEVRLAVRPEKYDRLLDRVEWIVTQLCMAIVLAAIILSMTYLSYQDDVDPVTHFATRIVLLLTVVIGVWWLSVPLRSWWRRRKD